jgi:predicted Zn-dependent peptidase
MLPDFSEICKQSKNTSMSYVFKKQPNFSLPTKISIPPIETIHLAGGEKLHILSTETTSLIGLEIRFNAGIWYQENSFQSYLTGKMLSEGTRSYSSQQIAETIDFYGGYYGVSVQKDIVSAQLIIPKAYLSNILPVISEILFEPEFPENELVIIRENLIHQINLDNQQSNVIAQKKLNITLFGKDYPYGKIGNPDEVNLIDRKKIIDFYQKHYLHQNAQIFIVGNINKEDVLLIEQHLSPQRQIIQIEPVEHKIEPDSLQKHTIYREQSTQASIRLGKVLFNIQHPDFIDLHIASVVLGGYFGSRLMSNLREDKGYTYGVGSHLVSYFHSGIFGISTDVGLEHTDKAIAEIYHEIDKLHNQEISEEELSRVKNYLSGSFLKNFDGAFNIMNQYAEQTSMGLPINQPQQYLDKINNITALRIKELFNTYLQKDSLALITVRKSEQ